ncbi:uncharacterized protein N7515_005865 [Penicillium bovifimosum]|uniref:Aminoglycoside phosphotransferase domain-containing protein n=1 Tax=Penicillium bovifimosum TaxID=126998 RepID=A0A9W9GTW6_9EURO|nr:uncharacterized protein N7515_005865 [Penicillium bovifimosum]KAJ5129826.1 hypothetical protein N7515_005865 [Penicillium bovifimosum]
MTESPPTGVLFDRVHLQQGQRYIKDGNLAFPCQSPVNPLDLPKGQEVVTVLAKQNARIVLEWDESFVTKSGFGILFPEAEAMKLVAKHTDVPVPEVIFTHFDPVEDVPPSVCLKPSYRPPEGTIGMTIVPGITLEKKWDTLDDEAKESICLQLWNLTSKIRNIPRPQELEGLYQCAADGSPSQDPMLEDLQKPARPILNDSELHARIYERYLHFGGRRYENQLLDMFPLSERSVFTHADIAPRNVMVDEQNNVTGILDWEWAGWYPEYWEYAQIMRPAFWGDFQNWMDRTAPQRWDLRGINAARKVLF